jgi:ATP-dependent Lon protease
MAGQMGLGPITDIISYTLPFEVEEKLRLLADPDVDARAQELVRLLKSGTIELHSVSIEEQTIEDTPNERFPPPFSVN